MQRLLLCPLIIFFLAIPVKAGLGPADTQIRGETFDRRSTNYKNSIFEAYCARWHNKCKVQFTEELMIVNDQYKLFPKQIIRAWNNQITGKGFIYIIYEEKGRKRSAQFVFTNMTSASEFWNQLNLLIAGKRSIWME